MLNCIVSSLERGASKEPLFEFTPEFYMKAAINAFHGLRHYLHPTTNFDDIPGTRFCLLQYIFFSFEVLQANAFAGHTCNLVFKKRRIVPH